MSEKRPSWKDILWTPVYDFVDTRWGTGGLRLFAISIGLTLLAAAWWGLGKGIRVVVRGVGWIARKSPL